MEFRPEPSLNYIGIKEPCLYELYQSATPGIPSDRQISATESEAYICSEKDKNLLVVYLAFRDISTKMITVYLPQAQPRSAREYENCIDAATGYMNQLGFSMKKVNLDYSTAMRQVIWGTIQIFKAPKAQLKTVRGEKTVSSNPETASTGRQVENSEPSQEPGQPATAVTADRSAEQDILKNALLQQLEQSQDEVKRLQKKLNVLHHANDEEKRYLESEIALLKDRLAISAASGESEKAGAESEYSEKISILSTELEQLQKELKVRESELSTLKEQLDAEIGSRETSEIKSSAHIKILEDERDTLSSRLEMEQERCARLSDEVENWKTANGSLHQDFESLKKIVAEQKEKFENELLTVIDEKNRIDQVATAALDSARIDRQELVAQSEAKELALRKEIERLQADCSETGKVLETALADTERVKRELLIQKRVAAREHAGLRSELRRLVEERTPFGEESHPVDLNENIPVIIPNCTNLIAPEIPQKTVDTDENNLDSPLQLARRGNVIDTPVASDFSQKEICPDAEPVQFQTECQMSFPVETAETGTMATFSGSNDGATEFEPADQLNAVPFDSPDDLYALYESANKVQAVPDGFRAQRSGGYVCAVNHDGNREIYLVWQMLESRQTQLFAPSQQPSDDQTFQKVLQDALFYFDSIGFMMTPVDLSRSSHRVNALKKMEFSGKL